MTSSTQDRIAGLNGGVAIKRPVKAATTANITLSGEQTIDGVSIVTDDRVLVKNQTTTTENGIYYANTSTWTRAEDFDGDRDVATGTMVHVVSGTTNAATWWYVSTSGDPDPGDAMAFTQVQTTGATGATGATGPQGATGADGTVDISTLTNITTLDDAADEFIVRDDSDSGTNKAIVVSKIFTNIALLTTETTVDATNDYLVLYDATDSDGNKVTPAAFLTAVNGLTADTTPDGTADYLLTYDASASAAKKVLPTSFYKTINDVTEDTSPDVTADFFVMYDTSGTAAKKVLPTNIFKGINSLTADGSPDSANDYLISYDASSGTAKKVLMNLVGGGSAASTTAAGIVELATAAEVQTGTDTGRVPSVSVLGSHQSVAKFWVRSPGSSTVTDSYNVTSITDNAVGDFTITIATDFANANWAPFATTDDGRGGVPFWIANITINSSSAAIAAGTVHVRILEMQGGTSTVSLADRIFTVCGFGDQ